MRDDIIRRPDALERGATDRDLQRRCNSGAWTRLHPGAFVDGVHYAELDARARHRLHATAMLAKASRDAVLSHQSAAVMHGLDLWNTPLGVVHLTRDRRSGGRKSRLRHVHSATLTTSEVVEIDGWRGTALPRTALDLARSLSFEESLVAGDHALHSTELTSSALDDAVTAVAGRPGAARARRVFDLLDGRSESVGESRSRALFIRQRLPLPDLQSNLFSDTGLHLGRVDFLLQDLGVVGEFDGRVKYGRLVPAGQVPADVLWAEKLREDQIRDAGWQVVRWVWNELATPHVIVDRVTKALARARKCPPPTGNAVPTPKP